MTTRVEILRSFCLGQGVDALIGQVLDLPDARARLLIAQGKARPQAAQAQTAAADEPNKPIRSKRNA
jgi:hypothetical protein